MAHGIGAADGTWIDTWFRAPDRVPGDKDFTTFTPVGWLYTEARWWANWNRRRAFDRIPSYAVLEPAGNHTFGATKAELRLGCPAWPR